MGQFPAEQEIAGALQDGLVQQGVLLGRGTLMAEQRR
jgi:hypothetical protein